MGGIYMRYIGSLYFIWLGIDRYKYDYYCLNIFDYSLSHRNSSKNIFHYFFDRTVLSVAELSYPGLKIQSPNQSNYHKAAFTPTPPKMPETLIYCQLCLPSA